jgi:hypothetical protein
MTAHYEYTNQPNARKKSLPERELLARPDSLPILLAHPLANG